MVVSLDPRLIAWKSSKIVFSDLRLGGQNEGIYPPPKMSLANPASGVWSKVRRSRDESPSHHGLLPPPSPIKEVRSTRRARLSQVLKQATGLSFWNGGRNLVVRSASFLSFFFLPSCSKELTLGGSPC